MEYNQHYWMFSYQPEEDAKKAATMLSKMLSSSYNYSDGQWKLAEEILKRVYVDHSSKKQFAVKDYL